MPKQLLKIILRRYIETIQAHNNSIKAYHSGNYWQFQSEAYRDALAEAGVKLDCQYRRHYNGQDYDILTTSVSIISDMTHYHDMLTEIGFVRRNNTYVYCFKTY